MVLNLDPIIKANPRVKLSSVATRQIWGARSACGAAGATAHFGTRFLELNFTITLFLLGDLTMD